MALVFARFLFGFILSLTGVALLAAATWICTRVVALAIQRLPTRRAQDFASGASVLIIVILTLVALYLCGHQLYRTLGDSSLAHSMPHWLAGADNLSAAAVLGALAGLGGLAGAPALWRYLRERSATDPQTPAAKPPKPAKPAAKAKNKAPARTSVAPKGARIAQLGWFALFLLGIGAALLAFAFIVAPPAAHDAAQALTQANRAQPVYLAAAGLLGTGVLCLLLWQFWRRPLPAARQNADRDR